MPGIGWNPAEGNDAIRPWVYGCRGSANTSRVGPYSTISPEYMTAVRDARADAVPSHG